MPTVDYRKPWYHGSPHTLTTIREGSTITQNRKLAQAFAHKPALLSISDDGKIRHDGATPGFLYRLSEKISPEDVYPHPQSTMEPGLEWLTRREIKVELIGPAEITKGERLSKAEVEQIRKWLQARKGSDHGL